ncbi:MAG: hypothetical protein JWN00_2900 [Actinomycetia bacterium]|nr:hypothetical protein [Actinomycetes bacterium]
MVELTKEHYTRLIIEVDDPQVAIALIEQARSAR